MAQASDDEDDEDEVRVRVGVRARVNEDNEDNEDEVVANLPTLAPTLVLPQTLSPICTRVLTRRGEVVASPSPSPDPLLALILTF